MDLLARLLRLDTTNPPGRETAAATLLRDHLEPLGVECRLLARDPERANLVARLPGREPGATRLLLLGHTDTVGADPSAWTADPWGGEVRDGCVWGRGALDMKGHVAAAAVAMATLAREGFRPRGDLVLAACADEEVNAGFGLSWLCAAHPEAVRAGWAINEGGGDRYAGPRGAVWACCTAEKATSAFRVRVHGRSGHASTPELADNALVRAAPLLERLGALRAPVALEPEAEALVRAVLGDVPPAAEVPARLRAEAPDLAPLVEPALRPTVSPTRIRASEATNVIPGVCEIVCDCRLLPGRSREEMEAVVRAALGPGDHEVDWLEMEGGSRSALDTPLWGAIAGWVAEEDPGAALAPVLMPGFTDSHFVREAFGTVAYGFFPLRHMDPAEAWALVHSADERIRIDDLELGTRFLISAARRLLT